MTETRRKWMHAAMAGGGLAVAADRVRDAGADYQRICMMPIGLPDTWPEAKPKKRLEDLIAYEKI